MLRMLIWPNMQKQNMALFSSEKISDVDTVAFLFVYDKYYPIMD